MATNNNNDPNQQPQRSGPSFKGQMIESISQRLARERAELARLGQMREQAGAGRRFAMTFSQYINYRLHIARL